MSSPARAELAFLRELQRKLRFLEIAFPTERNIVAMRRAVVDRMAVLAQTAVFALLLLYPMMGNAHDSWISRGALKNGVGEWCCGEGDCAVMDDGTVTVTAQGYHFNGIGRINPGAPGEIAVRYDEIVPFSEVQPIAPDGKFWRCRRPDDTRRCAFGPPQGS